MYQQGKTPGTVFHKEQKLIIPVDGDGLYTRLYKEWLQNGGVLEPLPPMSEDDLRLKYGTLVQKRLDEFAASAEYDGIGSAASYAGDENPKYNAQGTYAKLMRSRTWARCEEILEQVRSTQRPIPTEAEFLALLPPLVWPEVAP